MMKLFTQREDIRRESRWRGEKDKFNLEYVRIWKLYRISKHRLPVKNKFYRYTCYRDLRKPSKIFYVPM